MDSLNLSSQRERLPIGIDDYKKIITQGCIYIDKTLLIKEFWRNTSEVILVTRPRRFGKSISLSMLKYFFEETPKSTAYLFENSKIWKEEGFKDLQGTYPVIHITFKDIKAKTWEHAYLELKELLVEEIRRTLKPLLPLMDDDYKIKYQSFIDMTAHEIEFNGSLLFITKVYKECTGKNTLILIDEYDAPITHSYVHGFYDEMIDFMRQVFSKALKGNNCLEKGFMTGVVRTAKDGILSGLNNPDIYTMLDAGYSDKFGFTDLETDSLLATLNCLDKKEELKSWYNGYVIGSKHAECTKIYNPWSVLKYLKHSFTPETYWANTGNPELLERLIAESDEETQKEFEILLSSSTLKNKQINQDVILLELDNKKQEPWSFLLFAGYLTAVEHIFQNNKHYYTLGIPNEEIKELYKKLVISALNKTFSSSKLEQLLKSIIEGNIDLVNKLLEEFVAGMCSSHDLPQNDLERSLHLFVLGLLASLSERYVIKSNLESGKGRYDILMHPKNNSDAAVVLEFKRGVSCHLDKLAEQALTQIAEKNYTAQLKDFGYTGTILCYGVAIYKKNLTAKMHTVKN